jgi:hypothetical protein
LVGVNFVIEAKKVEYSMNKKVADLSGGAVTVAVALFQGTWHRYRHVANIRAIWRRSTGLE